MQSDIGQLPARGSDAIEILVNDHQVVKSLLERLTKAHETTQRQSVLEQLKAALTVHNATEENLVYPAINKVARKKWESQRLYHETAEAAVIIFELDTMLKEGDESDFERKSEKLRDAILEHIDDEENSAFPHLRENAEPQEAQMLTESVREFRNALRFAPSGRPSTERGAIERQRSSSNL